MKKIISLLLIVICALALITSCSEPDDTKIRIGVMSGPTGMGMAKLMSDNNDSTDKYEFVVYSSPDNAIPDLVKNGKLDMLCLPTNAAATLSAKQDISAIAINCLGSLYLMSDGNTEIKSVDDLDGKTIYTSVATSTTAPIIEYILEKNDVDAKIEILSDHDTLVARVAKGTAPIVVLPEPKCSAALANNSTYSIDLNLSNEWSKVSDEPLTMGCIVAKNSFIDAHPTVVKNFLEEYEKSIEYIGDKNNNAEAAKMITAAKVIQKEPIAKKALDNLYGSIVYIDGEEMTAALKSFYAAIKMDAPLDRFYYEK